MPTDLVRLSSRRCTCIYKYIFPVFSLFTCLGGGEVVRGERIRVSFLLYTQVIKKYVYIHCVSDRLLRIPNSV